MVDADRLRIVFRVDCVVLAMPVADLRADRGQDLALLAVQKRPAGWFEVTKVDVVDLQIGAGFDFNKKCLRTIIVSIVCWIEAVLPKIRILRFAD